MNNDNLTPRQYKKWSSRRWLITLWAMAVITAIIVFGMIFDDSSYVTLATTMSAIPIAFTSLETLNKKWKADDEIEREKLINERFEFDKGERDNDNR